jgi:predicted LPLAT superfamily acyltransferase
MSAWQGKSKGTSLGYRIFVFLIGTTGKKGAYFLLRFVSFYYFLFSVKTSKHIIDFYRKKLQLSRISSIHKLYRNYFVLGQTLIDKVALMSGADTRYTFTFEGEEHLREMVKQKKGGLLLSGHLGNWEAAGHLLKRLNTRINVVMYDGEDEEIKKYVNEVTGNKSFNIIFVRNDLSHIYEITEVLNNNEIVCMHADRFLHGNKTVTANFFNEPARFPEGPFLLALRLNVPVVYVYAFKETSSHYHFFSTELKNFDRKNGDTVITVAENYASHLELMTRKYPEQWFNYYDFWKA